MECFSNCFFLQHNECESYPAMVFILFITILELSVKTMHSYNRCIHQLFPVASHWHTLLYNVVSSTPRMNGTKKSEIVINILWQLCHMLRTSKRHWSVIKCLKMATISSVHYPDILCRNGFVLENTIRILCTSVYPSIDELKGRNTISLCTFIFTLLPLVSASMSDTVVTSMIEVSMRIELTCEVILSRDPKHFISISNCAPDFLDFRDSMCSMITFDDWNIKVLQ